MVEDADVEDEIVPGEELHPGDEIGADAEVGVGLVLDQAADAAHSGLPASSSTSPAIAAPFSSGSAATMPLRRGSVLASLGHPAGFVEMLREIDVDLDEDELVDLDRRGSRRQVGGQHQAVQRWRALGPGIAEALRVQRDGHGCRRSENRSRRIPPEIEIVFRHSVYRVDAEKIPICEGS